MKIEAVRDDNTTIPLCSNCVHAAFDDAGVFCKEFRESVLNERVAEDCGAFEEKLVLASVIKAEPPPDPDAQAKRSTEALNRWWNDHPDAQPVEFTPGEKGMAMLNEALMAPDLIGLTARFDEYLEDMHCQLWGASFNIWDEEGRHKAALWLAETVVEALKGDEDAEGA